MSQIIDFHSHILPGIDDGSRDVNESIALLRKEAEQGITHVVATPHFYPRHDTPERFLERRAEAEAILREEMSKHTGLPKLSVGAEVYFFNGISDSDGIFPLTIGKERCILIEMPFCPWTDKVYRELEDIYCKQGLLPVVAHIDRYLGGFRSFGNPRYLEELPVLVQANAEFFLHRRTAATALRMLKKDQIHLLGSDCHNLTDRSPNLMEALSLIEKRLGREAIENICHWQQQALPNTV